MKSLDLVGKHIEISKPVTLEELQGYQKEVAEQIKGMSDGIEVQFNKLSGEIAAWQTTNHHQATPNGENQLLQEGE